MADIGTRYTDSRQRAIEQRMHTIYRAAQAEIIEQLDAHTKRQNAQTRVKLAQVKAGKLSEEEFNKWQAGQMFTGKQWKDKVTSIATTLLTANQQANSIIEGEKRAVFGENATYQSYRLEHDANLDMSFGVYDSATVTRILRDDPTLLKPREIDEEKDIEWNRRNVTHAVAQGIIQGDSIQQIAKRIAKNTASKNEAAMTRYARTAMTSAQNAGRMEVMQEASEMGIQVRKVWIATLDERTRDAHQELDGQTADINEPFDSMLGQIDYPGDPKADDANIWNCRCTLGYEYKEYPKANSTRRDNISGEEIEDMTYREWKEKKAPKTQPKRSIPAQPKTPTKPTQTPPATQNVASQATQNADSGVQSTMPEAKSDLAKVILPNSGISAMPLEKWDHTPTQDEIVALVGGADKTTGSCASAALAYCGNKAGYMVRDFRGGVSMDFFSKKSNTKMLAELPEVGGTIIHSSAEIKTANKLLESMEKGKEYWLGIGRHASIVRKAENGYEYLELQSTQTNNGWHTLNDSGLKWRFGCVQRRSNAMDARLMEVDKLAKSADFIETLKYINTNEAEQKKGDGGGIK